MSASDTQRTTATEDPCMKARFLALWQRQGANKCAKRAMIAWEALRSHYAEPHRHYHNMGHLEQCLAQFDSVPGDEEETDEVEMAIWFHDVIHQPGRADNETRSAALFQHLARDSFSEDFITRVMAMIEATTHREPPSDPAQAFLCDIDLSSFGMAWSVYLTDTINLMHEFRGSKAAYCAAQRLFLQKLRERPRIFLTDVFHLRLEAQARQNIDRAIELIEQGQI